MSHRKVISLMKSAPDIDEEVLRISIIRFKHNLSRLEKILNTPRAERGIWGRDEKIRQLVQDVFFDSIDAVSVSDD
jgi:hypothetical protein